MEGASIFYGKSAQSGGGGVTIAGARNGASIDASNFVVLGEDQGAPTTPAMLLSNREIPMQHFSVNWFDGCTIFSTTYANTPSAQLLEVQGVLAAGVASSFAVIGGDSTAAASIPILLEFDATVPAPAGIGTPGAYIACNINGQQSFFMAYDGQTFWKNPTNSRIFFNISDAVELVGAVGGQAVIEIEPIYNTSIPVGTFTDIFMQPVFTIAGGSAGVTQIMMTPGINQTAGGTGKVIGIQFAPGITSITGQLIAYENTIGDVLLQSNATTGRTGIHNNSTLSAWLHIGPGAATAGSGPLKLTAGPLLTTPEDGCVEYDGTNFYKTIGATRTIIL